MQSIRYLLKKMSTNQKAAFEHAAFWDKRYQKNEFAFGTKPNLFFAQQLDLLPVGRVLTVAEGEGRNSVYAAQ